MPCAKPAHSIATCARTDDSPLASQNAAKLFKQEPSDLKAKPAARRSVTYVSTASASMAAPPAKAGQWSEGRSRRLWRRSESSRLTGGVGGPRHHGARRRAAASTWRRNGEAGGRPLGLGASRARAGVLGQRSPRHYSGSGTPETVHDSEQRPRQYRSQGGHL